MPYVGPGRRCTETAAKRLFSDQLVDQVQRLSGIHTWIE